MWSFSALLYNGIKHIRTAPGFETTLRSMLSTQASDPMTGCALFIGVLEVMQPYTSSMTAQPGRLSLKRRICCPSWPSVAVMQNRASGF